MTKFYQFFPIIVGNGSGILTIICVVLMCVADYECFGGYPVLEIRLNIFEH